jgi:hypothetical protein
MLRAVAPGPTALQARIASHVHDELDNVVSRVGGPTALQARIASHVHDELDNVVSRVDTLRGSAPGRNVDRARERAASWLTFRLLSTPVSSAEEVRREVLRGLIELAPPSNQVERRRGGSGSARAKAKIRTWALEAAKMLAEQAGDETADAGAWIRRGCYTGSAGASAVGLKVHLE